MGITFCNKYTAEGPFTDRPAETDSKNVAGRLARPATLPIKHFIEALLIFDAVNQSGRASSAV
jgi:hypothetical protein